MILFVRRSSAVLLVCILLLSLVLVGLAENEIEVSAPLQRTIMLDAGHGAPDGGCVAADGTQEAPLNLAVCLQLQKALESRGFCVLMTRTDANGIHDSGKSIGEKKRADMRNRKKLRDAAMPALFVSIHMNQFEQTKYHGAQVLYDTTHQASADVAQCIQSALREKVDPENQRVPMRAPDGIYLLRAPNVPSLIVECGFLSNETEREKLKTADYQKAVADAIADGISQYFAGEKQ